MPSHQDGRRWSHWLSIGAIGSYLRLTDFCITQLKAQGPSRTCNESKEEEEEALEPLARSRQTLEPLDNGKPDALSTGARKA